MKYFLERLFETFVEFLIGVMIVGVIILPPLLLSTFVNGWYALTIFLTFPLGMSILTATL